MEAVAVEKNFHPARTGVDVLAWVVEAPALHEAYLEAVRVDGAELKAAYVWWPFDGFVDSTK